jgi:hypothetical protein
MTSPSPGSGARSRPGPTGGPDEPDVRQVGDSLMRSIVVVPSEHPDCVVPGGVRASAQ